MALTTAKERIERIQRIHQWIQGHETDLMQAMYADFRKPASEVLLGDLGALYYEIKHTSKNLKGWMKPKRVSTPLPMIGTRGYVHHEPKGNILIISPWNYPFGLAIKPLISAIATGNVVMLKPSEMTPHVSKAIKGMIKELFPIEEVAVFEGDSDMATRLLELPFNHIFFTGSPAVGKIVMAAAANHLASVTLELGGKSPVVVFDDADLELVIPGVARACFFLQGQNCMAGTRLFVHEKIHDRVVEGVAAMARSMKLGPGLDPASDFGPLISERQRERVAGFVDAGRKEGAELVCGGKSPTRAGWFYEPTVLTRTTNDMTPVQNEIFGPVLCVQRFGDDDFEQVARDANSTVYGLSGSVWTRDIRKAMTMVRRIDSGQVSVNMHAAIDPSMPFGGNKQSGWGREFGREGLEPYLKTKGVTVTW